MPIIKLSMEEHQHLTDMQDHTIIIIVMMMIKNL